MNLFCSKEFVQRALAKTHELEKQFEMIHNVANPLLQSGTVTNLMRSLMSKVVVRNSIYLSPCLISKIASEAQPGRKNSFDTSS